MLPLTREAAQDAGNISGDRRFFGND
jgi:hypothetical protein